MNGAIKDKENLSEGDILVKTDSSVHQTVSAAEEEKYEGIEGKKVFRRIQRLSAKQSA